MKAEKTNEKKIEDAIKDLQNAMIENIRIDNQMVDVKIAKEKARFNLQRAKEAVRAMEAECLNN